MKRFLFLSIIIILSSKSSFSTVDILYVNYLTKEYQYSDNGCSGFIGWSAIKVDGSLYDKEETKLIYAGYSKMFFPYKIELLLLTFIILILIAFKITRHRLNKSIT